MKNLKKSIDKELLKLTVVPEWDASTAELWLKSAKDGPIRRVESTCIRVEWSFTENAFKVTNGDLVVHFKNLPIYNGYNPIYSIGMRLSGIEALSYLELSYGHCVSVCKKTFFLRMIGSNHGEIFFGKNAPIQTKKSEIKSHLLKYDLAIIEPPQDLNYKSKLIKNLIAENERLRGQLKTNAD